MWIAPRWHHPLHVPVASSSWGKQTSLGEDYTCVEGVPKLYKNGLYWHSQELLEPWGQGLGDDGGITRT